MTQMQTELSGLTAPQEEMSSMANLHSTSNLKSF
jgi:hypothetical protein